MTKFCKFTNFNSLRRRLYDALPEPLHRWMAGSALPWSPASCRHIWTKARAEGASPDDILERLDRAERMTLSRDRLSLSAMLRSFFNDQQDQTI